ncbi:MAG: (2Fe-2S)-binding protein [Candidatus Omnitrophica bacterium]|nr:(2Fe-2S)-binding protein [Candidatus Omnitrophota bacterium]
MRIEKHPVLPDRPAGKKVDIFVDGRKVEAYEGEPIAAALWAAGIKKFRYTRKEKQPRGYFCGLGRCTDCVMTVDGVANVRTCITPVKGGMVVQTQKGLGIWKKRQMSW